MKALWVLMIACSGGAWAQSNCKCIEFPFEPEPPCNSVCFKRLATSDNASELGKVKSIDPGVALSLRILSQRSDVKSLDFSKITTKADLEKLAFRSVEERKVQLSTNK